jgi:hypothetical protein
MEGRKQLRLYGDPAYRSAYGIACSFLDPRSRHYLPTDKREFNRVLSSVRIAVEQAFGQTHQLWTYTAFSDSLRAGGQPIAVFFTIVVLLSNCFIYLRQTSAAGSRFDIAPLSVEQYLLL